MRLPCLSRIHNNRLLLSLDIGLIFIEEHECLWINVKFQVRGSIPLLWEQIVDLSYKPRLNVIDHAEAVRLLSINLIKT